MNIYFSYLLCLFIFVHYMQKKVMQVSFCDLHSAVMLADIVRSSRQTYQLCVMVHQFCRATKPCPQKSTNFVIRLTSALETEHQSNDMKSLNSIIQQRGHSYFYDNLDKYDQMFPILSLPHSLVNCGKD